MSTGGADEVVLYPPKEAARRLGVSGSGLRRLAGIYAELYGPLPRDESEQGPNKTRLWPAEALERLEAARALVEAKRWPSIREALEALERGEEAPQAQELALPPGEALRGRIEALAALPAKVEGLAQAQAEAIGLLRAMAATVERLEANIERLEQGPRDGDKAEYMAELERQNKYLPGELERRRLEAEKPKRRVWWKWWR